MRYGLLGLLLTIGATVALFVLLDLLPPRQLTMAAGQPGSAYHDLALRYRQELAQDGIALRILETPGSVANAAALAEGADVAILQGGVPAPETVQTEALAAILLEPMFLFHRAGLRIDSPADWADLRLAGGAEGSGTRAAVLAVLATLGDPLPHDRLLPLGTTAAAEALVAGEIDAAIFVAPVTAPYLRDLLPDPGLGLAQLRDLPAIARRLDFVEVATIPAAGFDYLRRIPPDDVTLPAMVARLVAREGLHPALIDRLVRAAERIHRPPDLITEEGRFPSVEGLGGSMNAQAEALLRDGSGVLADVLPFWATAQINRVAVLLLPLLFLVLPLLRALPGLYAWSMESRVYRHYDRVLAVDAAADDAATAADFDRLAGELDALDAEARTIRVGRRFRGSAYALRMHIDLVRGRLRARRSALGEAADDPPAGG